jgi:CBS domain-containing protein
MTVRDLMSPDLITCRVDASLGDVARLFLQHRIHGAFVSDPSGEIVGVISDTDLLSGEWLGTSAERLAVMREMTAQQLMSSPVVTIDADADASGAVERLQTHEVSRLLVTDRGEPVGVLSIADLVAAVRPGPAQRDTVRDVMSYGIVLCHADTPLRAAARSMTERRSRSLGVLDPSSGDLVGVLTGHDLLAALGRETDALVVADLMHSPALTIAPDAPLSDAADLMLAHEVHRLFVCDPERRSPVPLGLVSTADISAAMARPGSVWQQTPG